MQMSKLDAANNFLSRIFNLKCAYLVYKFIGFSQKSVLLLSKSFEENQCSGCSCNIKHLLGRNYNLYKLMKPVNFKKLVDRFHLDCWRSTNVSYFEVGERVASESRIRHMECFLIFLKPWRRLEGNSWRTKSQQLNGVKGKIMIF